MTEKQAKKVIAKFLKHYDTKHLCGCAYMYLGNGLYLVMARDDNDNIAKIAYNCDDFQCDYDYDWYMPTYADGNVEYTELTIIKKKRKEQAKYFYDSYIAMVKQIKLGNLLLEA